MENPLSAVVIALRNLWWATKPPGQPKLHWNQESATSRMKITRMLADSGLLHVVVVRYGSTDDSSERGRRKCLQSLAFELQTHDVVTINAEAREAKANRKELQLFNQLRAAQQIDHRMRLHHVPGPDQPLLWVVDVVAGVVSAWHRGVSEYFDVLSGDIDVISIDANLRKRASPGPHAHVGTSRTHFQPLRGTAATRRPKPTAA